MFKIIDGQLSHPGTFLEVVMDDHLFPSYTTAKAKNGNHNFNEIGDAMVRELDLSRITLRLVSDTDASKKGEDDDDIIKAKISGNTLETLRQCLYTPTQFTLKDNHGRESKITVSMRFLPVKMQLDPSESFNNAGNVRVEVLDGADLPAADRNGYSDPYCKFMLHGKEIYKTKTQKKTLHPAWNEFFETPIRSRTAADFKVDVMDWDFADRADHLGSAQIPLTILEPFQPQEVTLQLDGKSGVVRLKMLFKPDYVTRSRQGSSTFSGTFAAPGKIVGAPVKGATFVGGAAVGGVSKAGSFLTKGFKRSSSKAAAIEAGPGGVVNMRETSMDVDPETPGQNGSTSSPGPRASLHSRTRSFGAMSQNPAADQGVATVAVLRATGFPEDTKLEIRILHDSPKGVKEIIKTKVVKAKTGDATFEGEKQIPCSADNGFRVVVRDHHTFGSEDLGEAAFFINDQASGGTQEVRAGTGLVAVRSSFQRNTTGGSDRNSLRPPSSGPESPASRKGFNRLVSKRERSVTPSAG